MRITWVMLVSMVLWPLVILPAAAQETAPAKPLSLEECLDIAMANQINILVARNNVDAAQSRTVRAKSEYYPELALQNNAFQIGSRGVLTERRTGTAVTATQNIYNGGLREARASAARYNLTGSRAGLERTVQSVTFDVSRSYYELLRAKHLADVANSSVKYNEELIKVIKSRIEVGDAAEVDVLQVEAQLANAKVSLLTAQNQVEIAAVELQNVMGLSPQPGFDVQEVNQEPKPEIKPLNTYFSEAVVSRPDVKEAEAFIGESNATVKAARIGLYPRVDIIGDYQKGVGNLSGESAQIIGGITFDIFNGGRNRADFKEAVANRSSAQQRGQQVVKDIRAQVQGAYLNLNNAKERLVASQTGLESARKNYEVQQARYKLGQAITLDLLSAELQMVTAETNLVEARYDLYNAIAQMNFAVGKEGGLNAG